MASLDELLKLVASLGDRRPSATQPASLDALFRELKAERPVRSPQEVEEAIWAAWSSHPDQGVERRLGLATRAIAREEFPRARELIGQLVEDFPAWAEAWNKRATLSYLEGSDAECFEAIRRTLELEPRHFGAVCGFAQVCLRRGERATALAAFEAALLINPHLSGVRPAVEDLRSSLSASVH